MFLDDGRDIEKKLALIISVNSQEFSRFYIGVRDILHGVFIGILTKIICEIDKKPKMG